MATSLMLIAAPANAAAVGYLRADAPQITDTHDIVQTALIRARDGRYDDALATLDTLDEEEAGTHTARFAKARVLSWSGRYDDAEAMFTELLQDYPEDPDIQLGFAYLEYYRSNYQKAETQFGLVLAAYPSYDEALNGLQRAQSARTAAEEKPTSNTPVAHTRPPAWRLDYGGELSVFSRSSNDNWTFAYVQVTRKAAARSFHLRAERHDRFGLNDQTLSVGLSSPLGNQWDGAIAIEATPEADFRPSVGGEVEIGRTLSLGRGALTALRPFVRYSLDDYDVGAIHGLFPGLQAIWRNGISIEARAITLHQSTENSQYGAMLRLSSPASNKLHITIGAADAPEAESGVVIRTRTVFGGLQYNLTDGFSIRVNYARDDRENSFLRNALSVGVTHRF